MNGSKPIAIDSDFMLARGKIEPLKNPVELIDDPGEVAVCKHLGFFRCDLKPDGTPGDVGWRRRVRILARFDGHGQSRDRSDDHDVSDGYDKRRKLHGFLSPSNHGTNSASFLVTL